MRPNDDTIGLLYTGGTIGMRADLKEPMPADDFLSSLSKWPWASREGDVVTIDLMDDRPPMRVRLVDEYENKPIDSSCMAPQDWCQIASAVRSASGSGRYRALVILHGTDTMAWTSSALSFLLGPLRIPVIVTGSQRPLALGRTDAARNLLTSLEFASIPNLPREVTLCFDNSLLRGNRATKVSVGDFTGFQSPNFPLLGSAGVGLRVYPPPETELGKIDVRDLTKSHIIPIAVHPGFNSEMLPELPSVPDYQRRVGVLLEVYGSGTASRRELEDWLLRIKERGGVVLVRSRVPRGTVNLGQYGGSDWLRESVGAISGFNITSEASYAKLSLLLATGWKRTQVEHALGKSMCGEVDTAEAVGVRDETARLLDLARRFAPEGDVHIETGSSRTRAVIRIVCATASLRIHYVGPGMRPLSPLGVREVLRGKEAGVKDVVVVHHEAGVETTSRAEDLGAYIVPVEQLSVTLLREITRSEQVDVRRG